MNTGKKAEKVRKGHGFTFVEIVIVIAIISILAIIAVPNALRARLNANEDVIREDLRAFSTANEAYRALQLPPAYSPDIQTLIDQNYLDNTWENPGNKHGHSFVYQVDGTKTLFSLEAAPVVLYVTGLHYYCVDQSGVIFRGSAEGLGTPNGCAGGEPVGKYA